MATSLLESQPYAHALLDQLPAEPDAAATGTRRVMHLINGEHYSGAERVQDHLAMRLPDYQFDVTFACLRPNRFPEMRQAQFAPLLSLPMRRRFDLRPAHELARILRRDRFSILHTHTPRAALVGRVAASLARVPMVHHVHSPTSSDSTRGWIDRLNAFIERRSISRVAGVIAVSSSMGLYANRQGIAPHRIFVVPNGVPVRGPLPDRAPPRGVWQIGAVALFRPRKGMEVLLNSMSELLRAGVPVRLLAVGGFETPEYERAIKEQAHSLNLDDAIEWVGFTRDVPSQMARMDLFVLPSLFGEGLPMVVLEAMACGVPVIGTHVEGVPEAIRHGVEGVLAEPNDPADLAQAIRSVVRGEFDWSALRVAAHARHFERFSDDSMARGVAEVYNRILSAEH